MLKIRGMLDGMALHAIEQLPEGARGQRGLLRLAHLRSSHHLHRSGDLTRTAH
jgi:hypothetical protein